MKNTAILILSITTLFFGFTYFNNIEYVSKIEKELKLYNSSFIHLIKNRIQEKKDMLLELKYDTKNDLEFHYFDKLAEIEKKLCKLDSSDIILKYDSFVALDNEVVSLAQGCFLDLIYQDYFHYYITEQTKVSITFLIRPTSWLMGYNEFSLLPSMHNDYETKKLHRSLFGKVKLPKKDTITFDGITSIKTDIKLRFQINKIAKNDTIIVGFQPIVNF